MKTPDEIKKGLECCPGQYSASCGKCPYSNDGRYCGRNGVQIMKDALEYIEQPESSYSQISKALCGKENATLEDVLQAANQVKRGYSIHARSGKSLALMQSQRIAELEAELAAVKRERDAAVDALGKSPPCENCTHFDCPWDKPPCLSCLHSDPVDNFTSNFEWRGVCPENTEVQK